MQSNESQLSEQEDEPKAKSGFSGGFQWEVRETSATTVHVQSASKVSAMKSLSHRLDLSRFLPRSETKQFPRKTVVAYLKNSMRCPSSILFQMLAKPPWSREPRISTAVSPANIIPIWNTSVHITAFMPPWKKINISSSTKVSLMRAFLFFSSSWVYKTLQQKCTLFDSTAFWKSRTALKHTGTSRAKK